MPEASVAFAMTLLRLRGVGRRTVVSALSRYADEAALRRAPDDDLALALGKRARSTILGASERDWDDARDGAATEIDRHERAGVTVMAFGSSAFPPLLGLVPDPPAVLYARGDLSALDVPLTVAVIGTREPTVRGREIARRIARRFAEAGGVVVSGLAKGIDTAGHEGALEAGRTVAVLGTAIDKVYPAENKDLSRRIESRGTLVSEYPIGFTSRSDSFVDRDRLQAGLSVAVIPVQTRIKGGTQHTIKFAIDASRRVLCPRPAEAELDAEQNAGILELIQRGRATPFEADDLPRIFLELVAARADLIGKTRPQPEVRPKPLPRRGARRPPMTPDAQMDWLLPEDRPERSLSAGAPEAEEARLHSMDEVVAALDNVLDRVGPNYDAVGFDAVVRAWRLKRYPGR